MTADLATLAANPQQVDQYADPAQFVVLACERAKGWLAQALNGASIEEIIETKSQAEAIRVYTAQKGLGHDAELAAQEIVRRAERCIGLAIRKGQEAGEIARRGDRRSNVRPGEHLKPRPHEVASVVSRREMSENYYSQSDGVTDEQYDQALDEAKAEGDLRRTNVVRKIKDRSVPTDRSARADLIETLASQGFSSRQMPAKVGVTEQSVRKIARDYAITIPADKAIARTRRLDHTQMVERVVTDLENTAEFIDAHIDFTQVDPSEAENWAASLTNSIAALKRFSKQIKETAHV